MSGQGGMSTSMQPHPLESPLYAHTGMAVPLKYQVHNDASLVRRDCGAYAFGWSFVQLPTKQFIGNICEKSKPVGA